MVKWVLSGASKAIESIAKSNRMIQNWIKILSIILYCSFYKHFPLMGSLQKLVLLSKVPMSRLGPKAQKMRKSSKGTILISERKGNILQVSCLAILINFKTSRCYALTFAFQVTILVAQQICNNYKGNKQERGSYEKYRGLAIWLCTFSTKIQN